MLHVGNVHSLASHLLLPLTPPFLLVTNSNPHPHHHHHHHLLPTQHSDLLNNNILLPITAALTPTRITIRSSRKLGSTKNSMASSGASVADVIQQPVGVLFVCLGNICRSPAAEAVFCSTVQKRGLQSNFKIDSAGTIDYHEGDPADGRMRAAALKRGVQVTSMSRPIQPSDFENFGYILAMDKKNKEDILKAYKIWSSTKELPVDSKQKVVTSRLTTSTISFSISMPMIICDIVTLSDCVRMMCSYCKNHNDTEVPDPYYGGPSGFEKVLDLLEDACEGLLDAILSDQAEQKSAAAK